MTEVHNCPRCGSDEIGYGYSAPPMRGEVSCFADGCGAVTTADTEAKAIEEWNAGRWHFRPVEWDDVGNPCEFETNEADQ